MYESVCVCMCAFVEALLFKSWGCFVCCHWAALYAVMGLSCIYLFGCVVYSHGAVLRVAMWPCCM